jgi:DNA-directed RNA polymerase specialized sigma24 family protein
VSQQALLQCLTAWKSYGMPDSVRARRAYVSTAVRSVWCDQLRALKKERLHQPLTRSVLEGLFYSATKWAHWLGAKLDLNKRLAKLTAAELVLVSAVQSGLCSADIAELLAISKEALHQRLSRLCRKLDAASPSSTAGAARER